MNRNRRKAIYAIKDDLKTLQDQVAAINSRICSIKSQEAAYIKNIPQNMQFGEKCFIADRAVSNLDDAQECIDDIVEAISDAICHLDNATNTWEV